MPITVVCREAKKEIHLYTAFIGSSAQLVEQRAFCISLFFVCYESVFSCGLYRLLIFEKSVFKDALKRNVNPKVLPLGRH